MYGKHSSQKLAPMKGLHTGSAPTGGEFAAGFTGTPNPNKVRRSSGMNTGKKTLAGLDNPSSLSSITEDCCEAAYYGAISKAFRSMG